MAALRECQTAVVARNDVWSGVCETEPYEAGWASELVAFVRLLDLRGAMGGATADVQISPDGIHWCDEGSRLVLPDAVGQVAFVKVGHFGQYVRLRAQLPDQTTCKVIVTFNCKG